MPAKPSSTSNSPSPRKLKYKNGLAKSGDAYYYKFKMHGKTHSGSTRCASRDDAAAYLAALRTKLSHQQVGVITAATFDAVKDHYDRVKRPTLSSGHLVAMGSSYRHWLKPLIGSLKVQDLKQTDLMRIRENYLNSKCPIDKRTHSQGGLKCVLSSLRILVNFAVKNQLSHPLPFPIELPRVQAKPAQAMTSQELFRFLKELDKLPKDPQAKLAIRVMAFMGLRISEVQGMKWSGFGKDMTEYTPDKTKGKEASNLAVPWDLRARLQAWKKQTQDRWKRKNLPMPETVFYTREGKPMNNSFALKSIKRAAKDAGLEGSWSNHDLRRTFATILNEQNMNTLAIQQMLRHRNISTTLRYIRSDRATAVKATHEIFDKLSGQDSESVSAPEDDESDL